MMIFISHSSQDDAFVDWLRQKLHQYGHRTWVDHKDIPAGQVWDQVVEEKLARSHTMILVLSPEAVGSREVGVEWREFRNQDKKIIPLKIKDCPVPLLIRQLQHLDFSDPAHYDRQLARLLEDLPPPTLMVTRDLALSTSEIRMIEWKRKAEEADKLMRTVVGRDQILFRFVELDQTAIFDLNKDKLFIGWYDRKSGLKPDIDLGKYDAYDLGVSRQHAMLTKTSKGLMITDLTSRNGTYIDDSPLPPEMPVPLHNNTVLRLGSLTMQVFYRDHNGI